MRAWHFGLCAALLCSAVACGGKKSGVDAGGLSTGSGSDGGTKRKNTKPDAGVTGTGGSTVKSGAGGTNAPPMLRDAGPEPYDSSIGDAAGDYRDAYMGEDAGPPPAGWTCPKALWYDGTCDCGCGALDFDCRTRGTTCSDPGCVAAVCDACFTLTGSWKPCVPDPTPGDWEKLCPADAQGDSLCDCGCGIPDTACKGQGCTTPGCWTEACEIRHGCSTSQIAHSDDCSSANPKVLTSGVWRCPWGHYASGDGCDCGCGAPDPDCTDSTGGCTAGRCDVASCDRCNDAQGRPYACEAAAAGWDEDILGDATSQEPSQCLSKHFGSGDGCDCGCGGHDPDCGSDGCDQPGCDQNHPEFKCDRCADVNTLKPSGCNVPSAWTDNHCKPEHFGTGDGCDCGCGTPDPDCPATKGCTTAGCTDAACDVCNDGTGFYVQCPGWTCTDPDAFGTAACDCGCGVIDPYCRDTNRDSCTGAGCETAACQYCNDSGHVRSTCGGQWTSGNGGTSSVCDLADYALDGLCDCGCGAHDPDCKAGTDCTDKGCLAAGCEVCHDGLSSDVCLKWTCSAASQSDGVCDCGCGAPDPDCKAGAGCRQPGCNNGCEVCHDPIGRAVPCP